jgi:hypothetical protein
MFVISLRDTKNIKFTLHPDKLKASCLAFSISNASSDVSTLHFNVPMIHPNVRLLCFNVRMVCICDEIIIKRFLRILNFFDRVSGNLVLDLKNRVRVYNTVRLGYQSSRAHPFHDAKFDQKLNHDKLNSTRQQKTRP